MAPKRRKGYLRKNKIAKRRKKRRLTSRVRNPEEILNRRLDSSTTVHDLVYKYLRKIECSNFERKQQNTAFKKFRKKNARKKTLKGSFISSDYLLKSYIRKALSLGVQTGYLVPYDRTGKILELSPNL